MRLKDIPLDELRWTALRVGAGAHVWRYDPVGCALICQECGQQIRDKDFIDTPNIDTVCAYLAYILSRIGRCQVALVKRRLVAANRGIERDLAGLPVLKGSH